MIDFAVEPLVTAQADIESLLPRQWEHTGDREVACKPNWKLYRQFNDHGACLVVMARRDGIPVGYMAAFIYPHPNSFDNLTAEIPTYFVVEGPTRALILSRMQDFVIKRLVERGVFKVTIETNAEHSAGRLWELKGFQMSKIGYTMKLKAMPEMKYA